MRTVVHLPGGRTEDRVAPVYFFFFVTVFLAAGFRRNLLGDRFHNRFRLLDDGSRFLLGFAGRLQFLGGAGSCNTSDDSTRRRTQGAQQRSHCGPSSCPGSRAGSGSADLPQT